MSPVVVVTGEGQTVKVVKPTNVFRFVSGGPRGPKGDKGEPGSSFGTTKRYYGEGPPTLIIGASPGDEYVDATTGTLYVLN